MRRLLGIFFFLILIGIVIQWQRVNYVTGHKNVWLSQFPIASSGPFKGLLTGYWWVDAQNLQFEFKFEEVQALTKKICYLQPHNPKVWEYLSWNLSFNLMAESLHDRSLQEKWLLEGLNQLNKGLTYNPGDNLLEYAMGFTVFMKTRGDFDFTQELNKYLEMPALQFAKQKMIESDIIESGEYIMGLQAVNIFVAAQEYDLAIASCHQLVKRFPQHDENMRKNIQFIQNIVKERE